MSQRKKDDMSSNPGPGYYTWTSLVTLTSHGSWLRPAKATMWRFHLLSSGFSANGHLPWVSSHSHLSYLKGEHGVESGAVHRSPSATDGENPGKPQIGDRLKARRRLNCASFLPNEVDRIAYYVISEKKAQEEKEGNGSWKCHMKTICFSMM